MHSTNDENSGESAGRETRPASAALLGIVLLMLLVLWAPVLDDASWFIVLADAAHAFVFAGVAVLCLVALRRIDAASHASPARHYPLGIALTLILGLLTELIQIPLSRDASLEDFLKDVYGAWIGAAVYALFDVRLRRAGRALAALIAMVPGIIVSAPVIENASAYVRRDLAFPAIAEFNARFDDYFLRRQSVVLTHASLPAGWSQTSDEKALHVEFTKNNWPGLEFREVEPDWQAYSELVLEITNPDTRPLQLQLRVHDDSHNGDYSDRFNTELSLPAGERTINRIPLARIEDAPRSRQLLLDEVRSLILFVDGSEYSNRELYLHRIWLE